MTIAFTAAEPSLDAIIGLRPSRCPYSLIADTRSWNWELVENPSRTYDGDLGAQAVQLMAKRNVRFFLTGSCSSAVRQTLLNAGIETIVGCTGAVSKVIQQFKKGLLQAGASPRHQMRSPAFGSGCQLSPSHRGYPG